MMSPLPLIVIMWFMAAIGIICSLSFLYFNISKGKNRQDFNLAVSDLFQYKTYSQAKAFLNCFRSLISTCIKYWSSLHIYIFYFHFVRIIKMSSPKLNNIIIVGCILCYASIVLLGLDARFLDLQGYGINCNVRKFGPRKSVIKQKTYSVMRESIFSMHNVIVNFDVQKRAARI